MFSKINYMGQGKIAFADFIDGELILGLVKNGKVYLKRKGGKEVMLCYGHNVDECEKKLYLLKEEVRIENLLY